MSVSPDPSGITDDDPGWVIEISVPLRLPVEQRGALFEAIVATVSEWEPDDRDGWDADVSGHPAFDTRDDLVRLAIAAELRAYIARVSRPAHLDDDTEDEDETVREVLRDVCRDLDERASELENGVSAGCASVEGAQVAREQTTAHADTSVTGITDKMIRDAAQGIATGRGQGDLETLPEQGWLRTLAHNALRGGLAGRTVLDLPELVVIPTFAGCNDSDPWNCACTDEPICCAACGDPIEEGASAYSFRFIGCPWAADNSPDQEWGEVFWHESCDNRNPAQVSSGVAGGDQR